MLVCGGKMIVFYGPIMIALFFLPPWVCVCTLLRDRTFALLWAPAEQVRGISCQLSMAQLYFTLPLNSRLFISCALRTSSFLSSVAGITFPWNWVIRWCLMNFLKAWRMKCCTAWVHFTINICLLPCVSWMNYFNWILLKERVVLSCFELKKSFFSCRCIQG